MYSSKPICFKNSGDFIAINDPYIKPKNIDKRYKGKQFQTRPLLEGQTVGTFDVFKYTTDPFADRTIYLASEPMANRKNGFGSHDARRRDEFAKDVRARQWREKLKSEAVYSQLAIKQAQAIRPQSTEPMSEAQMLKRRQREYEQKYAANPGMFQTQVPWDLYDIGKDRGGHGTTPICNKCPREKFYCPHRIGRGEITLRRPGTAPTSATTYGDFTTPAEKPKFGVVSEHKSFYDNSHLTTSWAGER